MFVGYPVPDSRADWTSPEADYVVCCGVQFDADNFKFPSAVFWQVFAAQESRVPRGARIFRRSVLGGILGDMSFLTGNAASATVAALEEGSVVLAVPREALPVILSPMRASPCVFTA